jgi:hypothetical protein
MRKSSGLMLLLLAGAGSATLYAKPQELSDLLSRVSSLSSADAPAGDATRNVQASRVFSPTTPLVETAETPGNKAIRLAQAPSRPAETSARPNGFVAPLAAEGSRRLASSKPGDDDARRELTRDLQKELKRVGCFDGEVSGTWSPASKKAMSAFMDRVNATLPVEEPDYILLTLVQGHSAQACGKGCPPGQGLSNDGRCQPRAILAQSARKSDDRKPVEKRTADVKPLEPNSIQTGTLAKPQGPAASSWSTTTVASAEPPKSEVSKQQVPPQVPMAQIIVPPTSAPLPGRMAMGAPVPTPDEASKLDDIEVRKRRAQAALIDEQKLQAKTQADADRLKAERLNAEAQRREQQIKAQAVADAERQKAERSNQDGEKRDRQIAAADARRTAQRQAEALESAGKSETAQEPDSASSNEATKTAALAASAIAAREATERRAVARRAREAREREDERAERERERRVAARPAPRYVPSVTVARVAPPPTPRPKPEQRWTRTIFSDISRSSR